MLLQIQNRTVSNFIIEVFISLRPIPAPLLVVRIVGFEFEAALRTGVMGAQPGNQAFLMVQVFAGHPHHLIALLEFLLADRALVLALFKVLTIELELLELLYLRFACGR